MHQVVDHNHSVLLTECATIHDKQQLTMLAFIKMMQVVPNVIHCYFLKAMTGCDGEGGEMLI